MFATFPRRASSGSVHVPPSRRSLLGALALLLPLFVTSCSEEPRGLVFVQPDGDGWVELEGVGEDRPSFVDFGRVPSGLAVSHTFYLRNGDTVPIALERLDASCGCTVPTVLYRTADGEVVHGEGKGSAGKPVLTLPPDAVAEVTVRIDTENIRTKNVDKYNFVRVTCDSEAKPYLQLETHIIAERPLQATPELLDFGKIASSGGGVATVEIARGITSEVRLVGLESVPDELLVTLEDSWVNTVRRWTLRAEILSTLPVGSYRGDVALQLEAVDGSPYPSFVIPVRALVLPDVEVRPARLHLGVIDPAEGGSGNVQILSNLPDHRFKVLEVELDGDFADQLEASFSPVSRDANGRSEGWEIEVTAAPGLDAEVFSGLVRVHLDDAEFSPLEFQYAGLGAQPAR